MSPPMRLLHLPSAAKCHGWFRCVFRKHLGVRGVGPTQLVGRAAEEQMRSGVRQIGAGTRSRRIYVLERLVRYRDAAGIGGRDELAAGCQPFAGIGAGGYSLSPGIGERRTRRGRGHGNGRSRTARAANRASAGGRGYVLCRRVHAACPDAHHIGGAPVDCCTQRRKVCIDLGRRCGAAVGEGVG